jgi:uncharacterized membrane protein YeaQ/YmgE (transglycosylase-associated protein family)
MGIIWTLFVGLVVGALARAISPGNKPDGIIGTILLGIGGAFVGRFISRLVGIWAFGGIAGLAFAVLGAVMLLWLYRRFTENETSL